MKNKKTKLASIVGCLSMGVTVAAASMVAPSASATETKPNIILITADDYGTDVSDLYTEPYEVPGLFSGSVVPPTPELNELANQGVVFDSAWAMPACTATRGTWITGTLPSTSGLSQPVQPSSTPPGSATQLDLTNPDLLPKRLKQKGYSTAFIGKWHLTGPAPAPSLDLIDDTLNRDDPNEAGFDHWAGTLYGSIIANYYNWLQDINGVRQPFKNTYTLTENVNQAVSWINQQAGDQPYFMHLSLAAPHSTFQSMAAGMPSTPIDYDLPPKVLVDPDVIAQVEEVFPGYVYPEVPGPAGQGTPASPTVKHRRVIYNAIVSAMDTEMGRLLDQANIDLSNTYIIFMGDNGTQGLGQSSTPNVDVVVEPFDTTRAKGSLYRGGVEVPMIVAGPKAEAGIRTNAHVNSADVYTTILNLAKAGPTRSAQGISFKRTLEGKEGIRRVNVAEYHDGTPEAGGYVTTSNARAGRVVANDDYRLLSKVAVDENGDAICVADFEGEVSYAPDCTATPALPGQPGVKNGVKQFTQEFYNIESDPNESVNLLADVDSMSTFDHFNFMRLCFAANRPSKSANYYFTENVCQPFDYFNY